MKICEGPECGRPVSAKGLCRSHYLMKRRTGELKPLRKQRNSLDDAQLRAEKAAKKNGRPKTVLGMCQGPECDRKATMGTPKPLCVAHYNQQWLGKPLAPLQVKSPRQPVVAEERKCNVCLRVKPMEQFHIRNNGKPQSECKFCASKRARLNLLKSQGRTDEAQAAEAAWTAYVRVLNTGWTHRATELNRRSERQETDRKELDELGHDYEVEE